MFVGLLVLGLPAISGCSEKKESVVQTDATVDENKPISEVKAEAEKMDVKQLRAIALKYREVIEAKSAEVERIGDELLKAAVSQVASDNLISTEKTKELKAQTDKLNSSIEALVERLNAYLAKLKEKGEDVSDLEL